MLAVVVISELSAPGSPRDDGLGDSLCWREKKFSYIGIAEFW